MAHASTDKEIIIALGGPAALMALGYTEHAVQKWMQRGIPWKARAKVKDLAVERKKRLPKDFMHERVPPAKRKAA